MARYTNENGRTRLQEHMHRQGLRVTKPNEVLSGKVSSGDIEWRGVKEVGKKAAKATGIVLAPAVIVGGVVLANNSLPNTPTEQQMNQQFGPHGADRELFGTVPADPTANSVQVPGPEHVPSHAIDVRLQDEGAQSIVVHRAQ